MIKFNGLNLKDMKITDALASVVNGKKIAVGSEVIWEKSTSPLPSGYRQVEYLESTGTQYIDSGIQNTSDIQVYVDASTTTASHMFIFGARVSVGVSSNFVGQTNAAYCGFSNLSYAIPRTYFNNVRHKVLNDKNGIIVDDVRVYFYHQPTEFSTDLNLFIFALNNNGVVHSSMGRARIYNCKLYDNDTLVCDFTPCLDNNDRPCMFDLVTRQTFYNQGTGEFLYGNII